MKAARAWIGKAKQGAKSSGYIGNYKYVSQNSGKVLLDGLPENGTYEVRFYQGSDANDANLARDASVTFTVDEEDSPNVVAAAIAAAVAAAAAGTDMKHGNEWIQLEKKTFDASTQILVSVFGITEQMEKDGAHVVIYEQGNDRDYRSWSSVKAGTGQVTLNTPDSGGKYEVRLYRVPDSHKKEDFVTAIPFTVEDTPFNGSIQLDDDTFDPFTLIFVTAFGITEQMEKNRAYVSIYKKGAEHSDYGPYERVSAGTNLTAFGTSAPGEYEMRLYRRSGSDKDEDLLTSVPFTVKDASSTIEWIQLENNTHQPFTQMVCTVSGITDQMVKDRAYAGIYKKDGPLRGSVTYSYVKAGTSQVTLNVPGEGEYEMRLFCKDNSYQAEDLVTAIPFTVAHNPSFNGWMQVEKTFYPFMKIVLTTTGITDMMTREEAYVGIYKKGTNHDDPVSVNSG